MGSMLKTCVFLSFMHITTQKEQKIVSNCTKNTLESSVSCTCHEYLDRQCILCCTFRQESCCFPYKCNACWNDPWGYITLMQISVSIGIFIAVAFIVILIFKICDKYTNWRSTRSTANLLRCTNNDPCWRSMHEQITDRPPRYNDIYEAPPVYNTSLNRQTTFEAPPNYPDVSQVQISTPPNVPPFPLDETITDLGTPNTRHM